MNRACLSISTRCFSTRCLSTLIGLVYLLPGDASGQAVEEYRQHQDVVQWSQFRGPNASGIAGEHVAVPIKFGYDKNLLWKTPLPEGASSPCIWADRIFLSGFDRESDRLEVFCVDRGDGTILWRRAVEVEKTEKVHRASTPASGTIATDGERVCAYFGSYGLLCYDFDGDLAWSMELPVPNTRNGSGTSPIIVGDVVLLNRDQRNSPSLLAVDKVSGKIVWEHAHSFAPGMLVEGYATPVVWNGQALLHTHEGIRAIDLSDGTLVWQVNTSTTGCSTPVIHENRLFVATWQNLGEPALRQEIPTYAELSKHDADKSGSIGFDEFPREYLLFDRPEAADERGVKLPLRALLGMMDFNKDESLSELEWKLFSAGFSMRIEDHGLLSIELGGAGDVTKTHATVLEKKNIPEVPSPIVVAGRIYMVKNGGILSCLDPTTGDLVFRKRISASGSYYASPLAVGEKIYLASGQGVITVLQASDKLEVLATNDLAERIMATPATAGGVLYVRTYEHLVAFSNASN